MPTIVVPSTYTVTAEAEAPQRGPGRPQPLDHADGTAVPVGVTAGLVIADQSEIVAGIPLADTGMSKVVRRVIVLATCCATFHVMSFIYELLNGEFGPNSSGSLWAGFSTLMIELSTPACGYYGALHTNRQLTCCFSSCNLFLAIWAIMVAVRHKMNIDDINGRCETEQESQRRRVCETWTSNGREKYIDISSRGILICLGCLAFWFGYALYKRLAQDYGSSTSQATPLVGEVIALANARSGTPRDTTHEPTIVVANTATPGIRGAGTEAENQSHTH